MRHHLPLLVLFALIGSSIFSCLSNYWAREACIKDDVQNALAMTMKERECGIVDADTIRMLLLKPVVIMKNPHYYLDLALGAAAKLYKDCDYETAI